MIQLTDVGIRFKNGTVGLSGIDLKIADGEFVYVVGVSGAGKSTLTKLLIKEYTPTRGKIIVNGLDVTKLRKRKIPKYRRGIGFVYQNFRLLSDRTAYENVAFASECLGLSGKKVKEQTERALAFVGLTDRANHLPRELSAGEQQRVAIARAIANNPKMIIADEPTGNLDPATAEDIVALLESIHASGTTVIMATHDKNVVNTHTHRVVTISDGNIVSDNERGGYVLEVDEVQ